MSKVSEIWHKDPSELTPEDVSLIVECYREHRELFRDPKAFNPKTGEPKKPRRKAKATVDPRQIDLEDLIKETASE